MNCIMRKPVYCICENKGADQLRGYHADDLCSLFSHIKCKFSHDMAHYL